MSNSGRINSINEESSDASQSIKSNSSGTQIQFAVNQHVVSVMHGVGKIVGISEIGGVQCYDIKCIRNDCVLKIPMNALVGDYQALRPIVSKNVANNILTSLSKPIKKTQKLAWIKKAQAYEAKIYSGDLYLISHVLRELSVVINRKEASYSENLIYNLALNRLVDELAVVFDTHEMGMSAIAREALNKLSAASISKDQKKPTGDFDDDDIL